MKRIVAVFCIMLCLLAGCSGSDNDVPVNAGKTGEKVSCMSFNVLAYNTGYDDYLPAEERFVGTVATIQKYQPDIVGIQEATDNYGSSKFDWVGELQEKLGSVYDSRILTQEEDCSYTFMQIGAGLIIFYKKDRFELQDSGCLEYYADYNRYYQWVKLYDKDANRPLFVTNTHFSIDGGHPELGNENRTSEAEELLDFWKNTVKDEALFATGDYNCTSIDQPHLLLQNSIYQPSALLTDEIGQSSVDFCYMNRECMTVEGYEYVSNEYTASDGTTFVMSDHHPVMTYARYK